MFPATPPKWVSRESEILAMRLILIYLDSDTDAAAIHMWALQDETGIDWIALSRPVNLPSLPPKHGSGGVVWMMPAGCSWSVWAS